MKTFRRNLSLLMSVILVLLVCSFLFSACDLGNDNNQNKNEDKDNVTIKYPIDSIELSQTQQAMPIGGSFTILATVYPSYTDDYIVWSSTNESVLTVDDSGKVSVIGVGTAGITCKAANGKVSKSVSFKIMPEFDSTGYNQTCKTIADAAVLTITNYCYNTILGIPTKSKTRTFTAVIFKQSSTTYYFVSGYKNFKKIDGYDYQEWTATDCNGKKYDLNSIQHEDDTIPLGNNYAIAIGSINAYNLSALPLSTRGIYYNKETLYIKNGNKYSVCNKLGNESAVSPMDSDLAYSDSLYGAPVLDCEFNFVGIVIRSSLNKQAEFVTGSHIESFAKQCRITL